MDASPRIRNQSSTQLAALLRRSVARLARRLRAGEPPAGLTHARLSVLRWLHRRGAMTAGQIAAADSLQPQSITRLLTALEQDGLIVRHGDEQDRRRILVSLTEEGKSVLRADVRHRDAWLAAALKENLSSEECAILIQASELLDRLADAA